MKLLDQINPRKGADGRCGQVDHGNETKRPCRRSTHGTDIFYGKETHDDVGQARRPTHKRGGDTEHIDRRHLTRCVFLEAQLKIDIVEFLQERHDRLAGSVVADQTKLREHVSSHGHRDIDCGNGVGKGHHAVLCHLSVGDALHSADPSVGEDNRRANHHSKGDADTKELREDNPDSTHLPHDVGHADEDCTNHSHTTGQLRVITVADKVGHGGLTKLAEIRHHQNS